MEIIQMRYDIKIAMHLLLVVDMQPRWSTSNNLELQKEIQQLILWSMFHGCPIMFVEYRPAALKLPTEYSTQESLMKLVRNEGYDRYKVIPKAKVNGTREILEACAFVGYPTNRILVTGVDANCCVFQTVEGIAHKKPDSTIKVIRNACRASKDSIDNDEDFWKTFSWNENVSVCYSKAVTQERQ